MDPKEVRNAGMKTFEEKSTISAENGTVGSKGIMAHAESGCGRSA
jgi:hypothetical protein